MSKLISRLVFLGTSTILLLICWTCPWLLSDQNAFLKEFMGSEILSFLGVFVTITLASAGNLHLELNKFEERSNKLLFAKARKAIMKSVNYLIAMFVLIFILLITKPIVLTCVYRIDLCSAIFNSIGLAIIVANILILVDITKSVFSISASINPNKSE